jgi:putative endonuclease
MNYTYILRCADGSLYTGWTNNLAARLIAHRSGRGAKYTKTHRPVSLAYYETFPTRSEAMSREWHIKHLSRQQKEALILSCPKGRKGAITRLNRRARQSSEEKCPEP